MINIKLYLKIIFIIKLIILKQKIIYNYIMKEKYKI